MENASKALIIAGSILVAILLISVAVLIMNSTGDTQRTVEDTAKSTAARSFNAQFTPYEGKNQSAAQVRSLITAVNASNGADSTHKVTIAYAKKNGNDVALASAADLLNTDLYTVSLTYNSTTGYINKVTITGPKS